MSSTSLDADFHCDRKPGPRAWSVLAELGRGLSRLLPGLLLCAAVTLGAWGLQAYEQKLFGRSWLEALVLAILLGTGVRTAWNMGTRWHPGIRFGAKTLLEIAVVLLGASLSAQAIMAVGPLLLVSIAGVVVAAIAVSYGIGRALGLGPRLAMLVACGNSICGNSAIAAAAPVIGADGKDVASSIAFTAVLGVIIVVLLPQLAPVFGLDEVQYGIVAGLTVYAVPQVLAATAPLGAVSVQIGTLVKLVRVLMLGPVILTLSLGARRQHDRAARGRIALRGLVPWFVLGFVALAALRSAGLIPTAALGPISGTANLLTIISMAALGLGVDVRSIARSGPGVTAAVVASLLCLGAISLFLTRVLGIA